MKKCKNCKKTLSKKLKEVKQELKYMDRNYVSTGFAYEVKNNLKQEIRSIKNEIEKL